MKTIRINNSDMSKEVTVPVIFIMVFFLIVEILNYRVIACHICIIFMIYMPCIFALMYVKSFEVTLSGDVISVRNWTGKTYSFMADEIDSVRIRITKTNGMPGETMKVKTGNGSFRIDRYMRNYYSFKDYIMANVDPEKITVVEKDFRSGKNRTEE